MATMLIVSPEYDVGLVIVYAKGILYMGKRFAIEAHIRETLAIGLDT